MLAGAVYGTAVSSTVIGAALQNITGVLVLGSIWSISSSMKTRTKAGNVTEKFMALMAPELDRQIDVQVEWLESKEKITARGFAEFRDKTTALYQSRVRSMDTASDDRCIFRHPAIATPGRWYGQCDEGLATGRGYGLAGEETGISAEYLGDAQNGLASGTGGMILRQAGQASPAYYEGQFEEGQPDGVVMFQAAGSQPRVLQFRAGVESGKASEAQWKQLQF
jgi:hypothetical protein